MELHEFTPTDELTPRQRWSTWDDVEALHRGPAPRPPWVVTGSAAIDTELGILKTGKEADCHLLERAVPGDPDRSCVMVAKRYRDLDHRSFRRSEAYTEGRAVRNTRDRRAMAKKSTYGRQILATQWAMAEWQSLVRLYGLGVPVPYPVQIDGTELLMEHLTDPDGATAPRLAQVRGDHDQLVSWWDQLVTAMETMAAQGHVHGDLSPYNLLVAGDRVMIIDLPQLIDLHANPQGPDFLLRDCRNVCSWFVRRGLDVDAEEVFGRLIAAAW